MDQGSQGLLSPLLRRARISAAERWLAGRVLDVGCGGGSLASIVSPDRYLGFDRDESVIMEAASRYPEHRFQAEMPKGEAFDTVVALALIEHLPNPADELGVWSSLLAPSGRIVLTTPHKSFRAVHNTGAAMGIFSAEAAEEHEEMFDRQSLHRLAMSAGMMLTEYRRFLFGANQLAVLTNS